MSVQSDLYRVNCRFLGQADDKTSSNTNRSLKWNIMDTHALQSQNDDDQRKSKSDGGNEILLMNNN